MDRTEFIIVTAIALFGAFCLGFLSHWVISRLSHVSKSDLGELDNMAEALHHAEEARDSLSAEKAATEARLRGRLAQSEAEFNAAMEGLRDARRDADELRDYIATQNMGR